MVLNISTVNYESDNHRLWQLSRNGGRVGMIEVSRYKIYFVEFASMRSHKVVDSERSEKGMHAR